MEFKKDMKLTETINRQFLSSFPDKADGFPRQSWDTCDMHLESKQALMQVDPKGNPTEEGTWEELRDMRMYWKDKVSIIWLAISVVSFTFFMILFYFWGVINA